MRLIDADALDRKVYNDIPIKVFGSIKKMAAVRQLIEDAPTIDAVPVRHGEWIHGREIGKEWMYDHWVKYFEDWRCSNCGVVFKQESEPKYHYCPNCGAKMTP